MVVAEQEADDAVAEGADAVVEDDGVVVDLGAFKIGHEGRTFCGWGR